MVNIQNRKKNFDLLLFDNLITFDELLVLLKKPIQQAHHLQMGAPVMECLIEKSKESFGFPKLT